MEQPERSLERGAKVRRLALLGRDAREGGELADDPGRPHGPVATDGGVLEQLLEDADGRRIGVAVERLAEPRRGIVDQVDAGIDERDGVVDLVRDPGHQAAERGELVGPRQVRLRGEEGIVRPREGAGALGDPFLEGRGQLPHRGVRRGVAERDRRLVAERAEEPEIARAIERPRVLRAEREYALEAVLDAQRDDERHARRLQHTCGRARLRNQRYDPGPRSRESNEQRIVGGHGDACPRITQARLTRRQQEEAGCGRHGFRQGPPDAARDLVPVERSDERPAHRLDCRLGIVARPEEDAVDQRLHGMPEGGHDRHDGEREQEWYPGRQPRRRARAHRARQAEEEDIARRHRGSEDRVEDTPREERVEVEEIALQDRVGDGDREEHGGDRQQVDRHPHAGESRREVDQRRDAKRDQRGHLDQLDAHPVVGSRSAIPDE